jgi:hypothetical protein
MLPRKNINPDLECYVPLSCGEVVYFDRDQFDKVAMKKWSASKNGNNIYAMRKENGKTLYLHNFLYGEQKENTNDVIDHIDGNPLNNMRSNLRIVCKAANALNSKNKGYSYDKKRKRFRTKISTSIGKVKSKSFISELDAVKYVKKCRELLISISSVKIINKP